MGNDAETDRNYLGIVGIVPRRAPDRGCRLHWNMTTSKIGPETSARITAAWPAILEDIEGGARIIDAISKHGLKRQHIDAYLVGNALATKEWNAAKEASGDAFMDKAMAIADNPGTVITHDDKGNPLAEPVIIAADWQHARLRIDTLKWAAKVRNPRQYSDKSSIDVNVKTVDLTRIIQDANARLAASHAGRVLDGEIVRAALPQSIDDLL